MFLHAPEDISASYTSGDVAAIAAIEDFHVTRPEITSETQGDPRSLRFEFTFADNEHFGACTLVKEFVWKASETGDGPGSLVSKAVPIQWKGKKGDLSKGMLDMAVELEKAEEAMKLKNGGNEIELVEREGLWQYEKLREAIEKSEEAEDDEPTWLNWFGFRGRVEKRSEEKETKAENGEDEEEDWDGFDPGLLDVEIFPSGEDVAISLAEDLFPDAMDFFSMFLLSYRHFRPLIVSQCNPKKTVMRTISTASRRAPMMTWTTRRRQSWSRRPTARVRSVQASASGRSRSVPLSLSCLSFAATWFWLA